MTRVGVQGRGRRQRGPGDAASTGWERVRGATAGACAGADADDGLRQIVASGTFKGS